MLTGEIKRYDFRKGFGFIVEDKDGEDYFFHKSSWTGKQQIKPGVKVSFDPKTSDKGVHAENVLPVGGEKREDSKAEAKAAKPAASVRNFKDVEDRLQALESQLSGWKSFSLITAVALVAFVAYQLLP